MQHLKLRMAVSTFRAVPLILLSFALLPLSSALKFDLTAHTGHSNRYERCIRNFVQKETLVVVTAIVDGTKGDGQMVTMHVGFEGLPVSPTRLKPLPDQGYGRQCLWKGQGYSRREKNGIHSACGCGL